MALQTGFASPRAGTGFASPRAGTGFASAGAGTGFAFVGGHYCVSTRSFDYGTQATLAGLRCSECRLKSLAEDPPALRATVEG